ncbi:uncharacterized protein LOC143681453 isoform X3 [Tamandua tetradactyla]|uniref:uncharacterized protein LOC143681453 isoform X3 n=1 Tax=Tamandua tetradactyla TaxID=48850 RepID=UPI004054852D
MSSQCTDGQMMCPRPLTGPLHVPWTPQSTVVSRRHSFVSKGDNISSIQSLIWRAKMQDFQVYQKEHHPKSCGNPSAV